MQRGQWPPVWREALSGLKDKAYMTQRPVRGCGQTNRSSRGPREAMGLAFERRLEACVSDKRCSLPLPIIGYFGPVGQKATDLTLTDEACWGQSLTGDSCPNPHNLFSQHACTHRFVQPCVSSSSQSCWIFTMDKCRQQLIADIYYSAW